MDYKHRVRRSTASIQQKYILKLRLIFLLGALITPFIWLELFSSLNQEPSPHIPKFNEKLPWESITISKNDTLSTIFEKHGVGQRIMHQIMELGEVSEPLTKLKPDQQLHFLFNKDHELEQLAYGIDLTTRLIVIKDGDSYNAQIIQKEPKKVLQYGTATITHSLSAAGEAASLPPKIIMELVNIFGWDIDFVKDIRSGDNFTVLFEEFFVDDRKIRTGEILSAEFINKGKSYQAIRFTNPEGDTSYYTPEGENLRKAFLKTPVKYTRISSLFDLKRKHPVLHTIKAHKGVDYAAPKGTPVKTSGEGKIKFLGKQTGYGNVVIVQHGAIYSTLYAHLNDFKKGLRVGSKVKQGQTIAFVGRTGMATGTHLHYEFRINGVHQDPLKVKLPQGESIPEKYLAEFKILSTKQLALLDKNRKTQLASKQ